jgi:hypothetical protein
MAAGCASSKTSTTPQPSPTTATGTTEVAQRAAAGRDRSLEARLRKYLTLELGLYYEGVHSVSVTDKVLITTRSADPKFPYRWVCQTALDLASENSGFTAVEVRDVDYVLRSSSALTGACDNRY